MKKTGFTNAFVNKPLNKNYSYHGIIKPCNIQPNPDPFEDIPNDYSPDEWKIFLDIPFWSDYNVYWYYTKPRWPSSSDTDNCVPPQADGKNKYYFVEITYWNKFPGTRMVLRWNDGLNCGMDDLNVRGTYIYKAWFGKLWEGSNLIVSVYRTKLPSHLRIWEPSTGEFPGYYPVPQALIWY